MAENNIRDYTTIGSVKDFITTEIAPNYFPEIDNVSKLNVGLFGMITDIISTGIFDSMQVTSRYITEIIPGKSQLPEFIYAQANNFGITDLFAKCASCDALIIIKEADVINNGTIVGEYSDFYINSDAVFYIDNIPFSLPYDIRIRSKMINGVYNHYCTHRLNVNNSIVKFSSPFIRCVKTHIVNETDAYLALSVKLYQYIKVTREESIVTNNALNMPYVEVNYSNQLGNFEVFYKGPTDNKYTQLSKFLETTPAVSSPFAYYKLVDEGIYRISFSNDDRYFTPEYNSDLRIVTFETLGKKGNFNVYSGDNIYVESANDNVNIHCVMGTNSIGGDDAYTLDEVRRLTWEKQLTINSYTTDADLNAFFTLNYALYGTKALFIKTRDDFATRIFACYTRLKNDTNIFPTNTLDADVMLDKIDTTYQNINTYIIDAGSRFIYADEDTTSKCTIIGDNDDPPKDGIEYTNVAMISITTNPNTIAYYMNSIDKNILVEYTTLNDNALFQFIVKTLNFQRNAVNGEKRYKIAMTIVPADLTITSEAVDESSTAAADSSDILIDEAGTAEDTQVKFDLKKIKTFLYIPWIELGAHFLELKLDETSSTNNNFVFVGELQTDDMVNDTRIQLVNVPHTNNGVLSGYRSVEMQNPNFKFLVFYNEDNDSVINTYENIIPGINGYTLCNEYTAAPDELYLAYPMSLIDSTVTFKEMDTDPGYKFFVKNIPLFSREFLLDNENMKEVLTRLNDYYVFLNQVMLDITANFSLSLRFFNTYGRASTFTISNGQGKSTPLNRTHCDIWLSIKFIDRINYYDALTRIKYTIKQYIESMGEDNRTGINNISMSNLIKKLHDTYSSEIDYIIFNSINGYDSSYQYITMNYDLSATENNKLIPEYLTLSLDDIKINILNTDA